MTFGSREDRARQLAARHRRLRVCSESSQGTHNGLSTAGHFHHHLQPQQDSDLSGPSTGQPHHAPKPPFTQQQGQTTTESRQSSLPSHSSAQSPADQTGSTFRPSGWLRRPAVPSYPSPQSTNAPSGFATQNQDVSLNNVSLARLFQMGEREQPQQKKGILQQSMWFLNRTTYGEITPPDLLAPHTNTDGTTEELHSNTGVYQSPYITTSEQLALKSSSTPNLSKGRARGESSDPGTAAPIQHRPAQSIATWKSIGGAGLYESIGAMSSLLSSATETYFPIS